MSKNIFSTGLILTASEILPPPVALLVGLVYGFTFVHPYHIDARKLSKMLLQVSVVGPGFGMNLHQVLRAGAMRLSPERGDAFGHHQGGPIRVRT
jgi:uncharacterized membrane protein YadS